MPATHPYASITAAQTVPDRKDLHDCRPALLRLWSWLRLHGLPATETRQPMGIGAGNAFRCAGPIVRLPPHPTAFEHKFAGCCWIMTLLQGQATWPSCANHCHGSSHIAIISQPGACAGKRKRDSDSEHEGEEGGRSHRRPAPDSSEPTRRVSKSTQHVPSIPAVAG